MPVADPGEITGLLSSLVECPSVNPSGHDNAGGFPFCEDRFASLLEETLAPLGCKTAKREIAPGRVNFIAFFEGTDKSRSLMFEAHSDTVSADNMIIEPFKAAVSEGRLYGRGSCDTKGALAAMIHAARSFLAANGRMPVNFYLVSTCGEESGASGAKALMDDLSFRPDMAVVGEPTGLKVINTHKGAIRFRITTLGVPAHSSAPANGVNAIYKMARVINMIENDLSRELADSPSHPLGQPVVSLTVIKGGSQVNIVPDSCQAEVDRRVIPGETADRIAASLAYRLDQLARHDSDFRYELAETEFYPPLETRRDHPVARLASAACSGITGQQDVFAGAPWGSNAGVFAASGIPSVLFGPGSIAQAHTNNEHVSVQEVITASRVYERIIELAGQPGFKSQQQRR